MLLLLQHVQFVLGFTILVFMPMSINLLPGNIHKIVASSDKNCKIAATTAAMGNAMTIIVVHLKSMLERRMNEGKN